MRKYAVGFIALTALAFYGATSFADSTPPAGGSATAAATTSNVTSTQRMVVFSVDRGFPKPGTTAVELGFEKSTGSSTTSVAVGRTTITGHPSRNVWTYKGTAETYTAGVGVLQSALTGKYRIRGNRRIDSAKGHVTGGLGGFAGATGTFTSTGNNRVGARIATYVVRGTFTLP
ncbi:MAG: hypothetical protein ACXVFK_16770 [Solirubrobacteraceae bacterium]